MKLRRISRRRGAPHGRRLLPSGKRLCALALALGTLVNAACYTYVPVSLASVRPKGDVRVRVTDEAASRLVKELGTFSTELDGELIQQSPDSVSVGIAIDRIYRGAAAGSTTQQLSLGRSEVLDVRRREFSRSRTLLVTAGAIVGFGALAAGIAQIVDPNDPGTIQPPPPPPSLRRPTRHVLTVRISLP